MNYRGGRPARRTRYGEQLLGRALADSSRSTRDIPFYIAHRMSPFLLPPLRLEAAGSGHLGLRLGSDPLLEGTFVRIAMGNASRSMTDIERNDVPGLVRLQGQVSGRGDFSNALLSLKMRVVAAVVPPGDALVWRIDIAHCGDEACTFDVLTRLVLAPALRASAVAADVTALDVVAAEARALGGILAIAHTLVPDQVTDQGAANGDRRARAAPHVLAQRQRVKLPPGGSVGLSAGVSLGTTVQAALAAVFPHLSGDRSREALRTAHRAASRA